MWWRKPGQIPGNWELVAPISLVGQEAESKDRTQIYHPLTPPSLAYISARLHVQKDLQPPESAPPSD